MIGECVHPNIQPPTDADAEQAKEESTPSPYQGELPIAMENKTRPLPESMTTSQPGNRKLRRRS